MIKNILHNTVMILLTFNTTTHTPSWLYYLLVWKQDILKRHLNSEQNHQKEKGGEVFPRENHQWIHSYKMTRACYTKKSENLWNIMDLDWTDSWRVTEKVVGLMTGKVAIRIGRIEVEPTGMDQKEVRRC